jgi:hypothetical protein
MRLLPLISLALVALLVPAAVAAATSDGSLVVRNGQAPDDKAVVQLDKFSGSAIGRVIGPGTIIIDAGPNCDDQDVQVVGAGRPTTAPRVETAQQWSGTDFTFRAVGSSTCTFTIVLYSANKSASGGRVWLVAAGRGAVKLTGMPDPALRDGKYSLNDADFKSLPSSQSAKLVVGDS